MGRALVLVKVFAELASLRFPVWYEGGKGIGDREKGREKREGGGRREKGESNGYLGLWLLQRHLLHNLCPLRNPLLRYRGEVARRGREGGGRREDGEGEGERERGEKGRERRGEGRRDGEGGGQIITSIQGGERRF
jgi:hypothetical protein